MAVVSTSNHAILSYTNPNLRSVCLSFAWTANIFHYRERRLPWWLLIIAAVGNCRPQVVSSDLPMMLPLDDCHGTLLMISQHWLRWWFGAGTHQDLTWANVHLDLCRHMTSLGHKESKIIWWSCLYTDEITYVCANHILPYTFIACLNYHCLMQFELSYLLIWNTSTSQSVNLSFDPGIWTTKYCPGILHSNSVMRPAFPL